MSSPHSFRADVALIDIEGTISPTAFVRETLFGYSRSRIADYVKANAGERQVELILEQTRGLAPDRDPVQTLDDWQARDVKAPPLKALQGLIWESGYASGAFTSPIFPDALEALRRWRAAGVRLYVYSSDSRHAQDLFFRHNEAGDLSRLFFDFFDTDVGPKTERGSYVAIERAIGKPPDSILFLSDSAAELRAAESAELQVAQADRRRAHRSVIRRRRKGVSKRFGLTQALRAVDFEVAPGQVVGLMGQTARANRPSSTCWSAPCGRTKAHGGGWPRLRARLAARRDRGRDRRHPPGDGPCGRARQSQNAPGSNCRSIATSPTSAPRSGNSSP